MLQKYKMLNITKPKSGEWDKKMLSVMKVMPLNSH